MASLPNWFFSPRIQTECCDFTDGNRQNGKFCMTDSKKGVKGSGFYTDDLGTEFNWKCKTGGSSGNSEEDPEGSGDGQEAQGENSFSKEFDAYVSEHPWYNDFL